MGKRRMWVLPWKGPGCVFWDGGLCASVHLELACGGSGAGRGVGRQRGERRCGSPGPRGALQSCPRPRRLGLGSEIAQVLT